MSHVDRVNREVYKVSKVDIGFNVVNVALAHILAKELDAAEIMIADLRAVEAKAQEQRDIGQLMERWLA